MILFLTIYATLGLYQAHAYRKEYRVKKSKTKKFPIEKKTLVIRSTVLIGVVAGIVLLTSLIGFGSGQFQFLVAKAKCGGNPVIIQGKSEVVSAPSRYILPEYPDEAFYSVKPSNQYVCTEEEAMKRATIHPYSQSALERLKQENAK